MSSNPQFISENGNYFIESSGLELTKRNASNFVFENMYGIHYEPCIESLHFIPDNDSGYLVKLTVVSPDGANVVLKRFAAHQEA